MGRRACILAVATVASLGATSTGFAQVELLPPDGWIVFEHFGQKPDGSTPELDFDQRWIWLVHPDGSGLHELAPMSPVHGKTSPDVSPDGTRVVFNSWPPRSVLFEADIAGGQARSLSDGCSGRENDCMEWDPAYSADGERVAFVHVGWEDGAGYTEIGIRDLAGGPASYLTSTRVPLEEGDLAQPTWAPDGSRIAYHVNGIRVPHPGSSDYPSSIGIRIVATDGSEPEALDTPAGADAADPDWSPDGSRIVFSTVGYRESEGVGDLPAAIYTIRPDGSDPRLLCQDGPDDGCTAPTWLPDGDRVMYWGFRTWNLMDADGSDKHPIDQAHLTWFADGLGYGYFATWVPPQD
jgi:Tol biopolymer transport system component